MRDASSDASSHDASGDSNDDSAADAGDEMRDTSSAHASGNATDDASDGLLPRADSPGLAAFGRRATTNGAFPASVESPLSLSRTDSSANPTPPSHAPSHAASHTFARSTAPLRGEWQPSNASERGAFGRLVGADGVGRRVLLPNGAARAGEHLELLPSTRPILPARGLAPAPSSVGSLDSEELWRVHPDEVRRLAPSGPLHALLAPLDEWRDRSLERCERFGAQAGPLARALLFGDESRLPFETGELFTRTGVRHVLSVSGMHVALLAGALGACSSWASGRRARRTLALLTLAAVALYSLLSGAQAPVRRAALTLCLGLIASAWSQPRNAASWRRPDSLNLLAAAFTVELLADPRTLFTLSLQLSYSATLGLVLAAGPLSRWVGARRRALGAEIAAQAWEIAAFRPLVRMLGSLGGESARLSGLRGPGALLGRAARSLDTAIGASLAATLATAPLTWIGIGELSPVGPLATVVVGPLVAWLLTYGLAAVYLPLPAAGFSAPAHWLFEALAWFDEFPCTPWPCPPRPLWVGALASLGLALWAARLTPSVRELGRRLSLASAGAALLPWASAPRGLEVVALDVGHGSAIAVRTARNQVWLIDAGSSDRHGLERRALGPQLAAWEPARLNLVITHRDSDHAGAAPWLASRWPLATWVAPPAGAALERTLVREAQWSSTGRGVALRAGGLTLRVAAGAEALDDANESSSAVGLEFAGRSVVVTGDAVAAGIDAWLASGQLPRRPDLLVWPHHGDPTERASELLAELAPRSVWISAAREGGIEPELERRAIAWEATYRSGPLRALLEPAPP